MGACADGQNSAKIDICGISALREHALIHLVDPVRPKAVELRVGYVVSRPRNNSGSRVEHMPTVESTGRAHFKNCLLLSDRDRVDFGWIDGNPKHRYRHRLKLERTFATWKFQRTAYAHAELF